MTFILSLIILSSTLIVLQVLKDRKEYSEWYNSKTNNNS
jgi:Kef-type K+ transport system membrane component KefB